MADIQTWPRCPCQACEDTTPLAVAMETPVQIRAMSLPNQIAGIRHTAIENLKHGDPTLICTDSEIILELCRLAELGRLAEHAGWNQEVRG